MGAKMSICQDLNVYRDEFSAEDRINIELPYQGNSRELLEIFLIKTGSIFYSIDISEGTAKAGELMIIPPDTCYEFRCRGGSPVEMISVKFHPEFSYISAEDAKSPIRLMGSILECQHLDFKCDNEYVIGITGEYRSQIEHILQDILAEYLLKKEGHQRYIRGQLSILLAVIARGFAEKQIDVPGNMCQLDIKNMAKCVKYIDMNYERNPRLNEVARTFCLSRTYFCGMFKAYTGKTFNEYVMNLKIEHAKKLLRLSELSITNITFTTGFNNITDFSRTFRRITGVSPSQFRKE